MDGPCWSGLQQKLVERTKQQQQHREMNIAVRPQPARPAHCGPSPALPPHENACLGRFAQK
jgi:hypothetical protein